MALGRQRPGMLQNMLQMHRTGAHYTNFPAQNVSQAEVEKFLKQDFSALYMH